MPDQSLPPETLVQKAQRLGVTDPEILQACREKDEKNAELQRRARDWAYTHSGYHSGDD